MEVSDKIGDASLTHEVRQIATSFEDHRDGAVRILRPCRDHQVLITRVLVTFGTAIQVHRTPGGRSVRRGEGRRPDHIIIPCTFVKRTWHRHHTNLMRLQRRAAAISTLLTTGFCTSHGSRQTATYTAACNTTGHFDEITVQQRCKPIGFINSRFLHTMIRHMSQFFLHQTLSLTKVPLF